MQCICRYVYSKTIIFTTTMINEGQIHFHTATTISVLSPTCCVQVLPPSALTRLPEASFSTRGFLQLGIAVDIVNLVLMHGAWARCHSSPVDTPRRYTPVQITTTTGYLTISMEILSTRFLGALSWIHTDA